MRIPVRPRNGSRVRFNITPLIDIVFLLIIFFLAASHFVRNEMLEEVTLPTATQTEETESEPRRLIITMTDDERLHVAGRVADVAEVEQLIRSGREEGGDNFEVRIRADRSLDYRVVEPIILACARSGVSNFKFAVLKRRESL